MKMLRHLFVLGSLMGGFSACDQQPPADTAAEPPAEQKADDPAPPAAVTGTTRSPYFDTVVKHLDVGGTFLGYVDVAGDLDRVLETGQKFLETLRNQGLQEMPDIQIKDLVAELGLQSVTAMGASSLPIPGDRYRNQAFIHTPDGPKGLLTLFGTEAKPLSALEKAPSGTDIVVEQEFHLAALKDIALGIYNQLPQDQGIPPIDQMMQQPIPGVGMTVEEILDQANGRAVFLAKFDPEKKVMLPTGPAVMEVPAFDFFLELQGFGWVFEKFQGLLPQQGPFVREDGDGFTKLSVQIPPEVPFSFFQPVLLHDQTGNRLVLASRPEFMEACEPGNGEKITADADFKSITQGLPTSGNAFSYLSPRLKGVASALVDQVVQQEGAPEGLRDVFNMVIGNLDTMAGVTVKLPNGIHSVAQGPASFKSSFASAVIPAATMGLFAGVQEQRRVMARGAERAQAARAAREQIQAVEDVAVDAGDQMAGLEQAIAALRLYAVANNGKFPDTLADLTPQHLSEEDAETALKWRTKTGPAALVYFSGLTVASTGNPIILASPEPDSNNERAVAHTDGTTETVSEDDFFKLARAALEQAE